MAPLFCILSANFGFPSHTGSDAGRGSVKYNHTKPLHPKESILKVRKNLEAVFLIAAFVGTFGAYATAEVPAVRNALAKATVAMDDGQVHTVVVKAKRMTAAEKAAA